MRNDIKVHTGYSAETLSKVNACSTETVHFGSNNDKAEMCSKAISFNFV